MPLVEMFRRHRRNILKSTVLITMATVVAFVVHAAMYGPQAAFIAELFSTRLRYSGASLGYQLAGIPGGALTPILSIALASYFDGAFAVPVYVLLAILVTVIALAFAPETSGMDLSDEKLALGQAAKVQNASLPV